MKVQTELESNFYSYNKREINLKVNDVYERSSLPISFHFQGHSPVETIEPSFLFSRSSLLQRHRLFWKLFQELKWMEQNESGDGWEIKKEILTQNSNMIHTRFDLKNKLN